MLCSREMFCSHCQAPFIAHVFYYKYKNIGNANLAYNFLVTVQVYNHKCCQQYEQPTEKEGNMLIDL